MKIQKSLFILSVLLLTGCSIEEAVKYGDTCPPAIRYNDGMQFIDVGNIRCSYDGTRCSDLNHCVEIDTGICHSENPGCADICQRENLASLIDDCSRYCLHWNFIQENQNAEITSIGGKPVSGKSPRSCPDEASKCIIENGSFICKAPENICRAGEITCSNRCINPMTDIQNCGRCGNQCSTLDKCENGQCIKKNECAEGSIPCYKYTDETGTKYSSIDISANSEFACINTKADSTCGIKTCEDIAKPETDCTLSEDFRCSDGVCAPKTACGEYTLGCYKFNNQYTSENPKTDVKDVKYECIDYAHNKYCGIENCEAVNAVKEDACSSAEACQKAPDGKFKCAPLNTCPEGTFSCALINGQEIMDHEQIPAGTPEDKIVAICVDPNNDKTCGAENCSSQGKSCTGDLKCSESVCRCPDNYIRAGETDTCVNPSDNNTCGATAENPYGTKCPEGESMCDPETGSCSICLQGTIFCSGTCVNPKISNAYCGAETGPDNTCINYMSCDENTESCADGKCVCKSGFARCSDDGKCIEMKTFAELNSHCGAKGECSSPGNGDNYAGMACNPYEKCKNDKCVCSDPEFITCNGRCTDPNTDPEHCGATKNCNTEDTAGTNCLTIHPGAACVDGICQCPENMHLIGGKCIDTSITPICCGVTGKAPEFQCKTACNQEMPLCVDGICSDKCAGPGEIVCGGICVNPGNSELHLADNSCACKEDVPTDNDNDIFSYIKDGSKYQTWCDSNKDMSDGCESLLNSPKACGACDVDCTGEPAKKLCLPDESGKYACSCAAGETLCKFKDDTEKCVDLKSLNLKTCNACMDNFIDANDNLADGCEIDTSSNVEKCGPSQVNCREQLKDAVNITDIMCSNGKCSFKTCSDIIYGNCDNDFTNGCEHEFVTRIYDKNDKSDFPNCQVCGNTCNSMQSCRIRDGRNQSEVPRCCYENGVISKKDINQYECCDPAAKVWRKCVNALCWINKDEWQCSESKPSSGYWE